METFVRIQENVSEPKLNGKGWGDSSVGRSICAANMRHLVQIPSTHAKSWLFLHMRLTPKLGREGDGSKQEFAGQGTFSSVRPRMIEEKMQRLPLCTRMYTPLYSYVHMYIYTYNTSPHIHTNFSICNTSVRTLLIILDMPNYSQLLHRVRQKPIRRVQSLQKRFSLQAVQILTLKVVEQWVWGTHGDNWIVGWPLQSNHIGLAGEAGPSHSIVSTFPGSALQNDSVQARRLCFLS